jgi:hypothetical protein
MSAFDVVIDGRVESFYESERGNVNVKLLDNARSAVVAAADESESLRARIRALCPTADAVKVVPLRLTECVQGYREPRIAPVDGATLVSSQRLQLPVDEVQRRGKEPKTDAVAAHDAHVALKDLSKPLALEREVDERGATVRAPVTALLDDPGLTFEVLLPLHRYTFANDFAFVHRELGQLQKDGDALAAELKQTIATRLEAEQVNDAQAAETLHWHEITIREKMLKLARSRVDAASSASTDANEFVENTTKVREDAATRIKASYELLTGLADKLTNDMTATAALLTSETDRHQALDKAEKDRAAELQATMRNATQERKTVWEEVLALLERDHKACATIRSTHEALIDHAIRRSRRQMEFEAFTSGVVAHSELLDGVRENLDVARRLRDDVREYVGAMEAKLDAKGLVEEAVRLRHEQQLAYLREYGEYMSVAHDLKHRKETRIVAVRRLARNLELQIREAQHLLDPNTQKYERDLTASKDTVERLLGDTLQIHERASKERDLWKPVEELLEEDDVDFDPPDLRMERELCDRKTAALSVAREYVTGEQEYVDRDAMELRKVKTAAKVAVEAYETRRSTRDPDAPALEQQPTSSP